MRLSNAIQRFASAAVVFLLAGALAQPEPPHSTPDGYALPNGWKITPPSHVIPTEDMVLKIVTSPDDRVLIASHSGYNPHGLVVADEKSEEAVQRIRVKTTWLGMAWSPDGKTLYVSGGNANGKKRISASLAPIYEFSYKDGKLSEASTGELNETIDKSQVWWSGMAYHPRKSLLYAANRGTGPGPSNVVVFDTKTREIVTRIPVDVNPYELVFTPDGERLFVSNWASNDVSVIDTARNRVIRSIDVGANPNDMKLSNDGRLFVACSNDNTVHVIDTKTLRTTEVISTTITPQAPEGSTPDALAIDQTRRLLYVANADNNDVAVINIADTRHSDVLGFIPTGWYPSALALSKDARELFIGTSKGESGHADIKGPTSPLASKFGGDETVKTLQKGSIEFVNVSNLRKQLAGYTKQVMANSPYRDSQLVEARASKTPSVIPSAVGAGSPIEHIIYIIKENRTYDQVFGDIAKGNGDARLAIFGGKVTPNQHALANQFVLLDNLYCDGEVSVDGHSWSNSAYATDFNERLWPPTYAGFSDAAPSRAYIPAAGHLWDLARRKGLTYRSYGEYAARVSDGTGMDAAPGADALYGHVSRMYKSNLAARDPENMKIFLKDFDEYEKNIDSADANKRLPNYIVMSLPENHTKGTTPGAYTPQAMVASNDYAVGLLVDRVTHSKYWPTTAIFIIEDDAQDGPDHVDARRTAGLVISPYVKRGIVDSTQYSTSSMVRSMELLLGLPPMSQYDAAAMPMYASFGITKDVAPYTVIPPEVDLLAKNTNKSYGAAESKKMDFKELDEAPMNALNEILWKSIKGADSSMPSPVHRFRALTGPE
jgi:YVTN family beta-propeller protein